MERDTGADEVVRSVGTVYPQSVFGELLRCGKLSLWMREQLDAAIFVDGYALVEAVAGDGWTAEWPRLVLDRGIFKPRYQCVWFEFNVPILDGVGHVVVPRCGAACHWQDLWWDEATPVPEVARVMRVREEVRWILHVWLYDPFGKKHLEVRCAVDAQGHLEQRSRDDDPQLDLPPYTTFWIDDVLSRIKQHGTFNSAAQGRRAPADSTARTGALLRPVLVGLSLLSPPRQYQRVFGPGHMHPPQGVDSPQDD